MLFYFATAPSYNVIFSNIKPIFSSSVLYFLLYTQKDKASCSLGNFAFHTTSLLYHLFHTEQSYFLLSPPFIFSTFSSHSDIFRIIRSVYCRQRFIVLFLYLSHASNISFQLVLCFLFFICPVIL